MAIEKELLNGLNLLLQGKEEGFNILYSHTYDYVYSKARFIMKNEEDALDLTQETFIQAYRGIGSLEDASNVYAWLGGIVYRQGMKIYRKKRELLVNEEGEGIFEDVISEDMSSSPEDAAQAKATSEIVMSMIEELPEMQRSAVLAFYYDNLKIDDIAKLFECSANTIKSRLNYAKKFLKGRVEEHEKKNRYKLCSLSPAILLLAFKKLFATDGYFMSKETAQMVYNTSCGAVGLTPSSLTLSASAATQTMSGTVAAVQTSTATSTQAGGVASAATKVGLTLGAKIAIGLSLVAVTGAIAIGVILHNKDTYDDASSSRKEALTESSEHADSKVEQMSHGKTIVAESEIVVKVGEVNIPITSTWDELLELAYENDWEVSDALYPDPYNEGYLSAYSTKGQIETPQGDLLVCLMPNADYSGAEIKYIALSPFYLETEEDASVLGITPSTDIKKIGKEYEVLNDSDPYLYKVDQYVVLKVELDTYEDKNTVRIERTDYKDRNNETETSSEAVTEENNKNGAESQEATDTNRDWNLFGSAIGPVAEEDLMIRLGNVEFKLAQSWKEFKGFMDANGWTMNEADYPTMLGYGGGTVSTPYGKIDVTFMKNGYGTAFELESIHFSFTEVKAEDLNIHGITMKTTPDRLKEVLEYLPDYSGAGYDVFKLDDYLMIQLMNTLDDPQEYHITISRTPYFKRSVQ